MTAERQWDPSHEDPHMKTEKLRRELTRDVATIAYTFAALVSCIWAPFAWTYRKLRVWRRSLNAKSGDE